MIAGGTLDIVCRAQFFVCLITTFALALLFASCDQAGLAPSPEDPAGAASERLTFTPMPNGASLLEPGASPAAKQSGASPYGCYLASRPYTDEVQFRSVYLHFPEDIVEAAGGETKRLLYRVSGHRVGRSNTVDIRYGHCIVPDAPSVQTLTLDQILNVGREEATRKAVNRANGPNNDAKTTCEIVEIVETCAGSGDDEYCGIEEVIVDCGGSSDGGSGSGDGGDGDGGSGDGWPDDGASGGGGDSSDDGGGGSGDDCAEINPPPGSDCAPVIQETLSETSCTQVTLGSSIPPWDVVDLIALGMTVRDFAQNPTWANAGWVLVDGLCAAAPIIPSTGLLRHGQNLLASSDQIGTLAEFIGEGHAYTKHIGEYADINTREEFIELIDDVIRNSNDMKPNLNNGRTAWWNDSHQTVVIFDPNHADLGTAFKPDDGYQYFLDNVN